MNPERTLYYVNGSISSWRVLFALHEKGIPFVPHRLRLMGKVRETRTPEFLAINPRGQAPVLVEADGTRLPESFAILHWLELRYPDPQLLPSEPAALARALVRAHEAESLAVIYEPMEQQFLTKFADMTPEQREAVTDARDGVLKELALWEKRAGEALFIAGDSLTLADCSFYPTLAYMMRRGLGLKAFPNLDAYQRRIRERPAAIASHPEGWGIEQMGKPNLFSL